MKQIGRGSPICVTGAASVLYLSSAPSSVASYLACNMLLLADLRAYSMDRVHDQHVLLITMAAGYNRGRLNDMSSAQLSRAVC
jgi:hypothetical protein